MGKNHPDRHQDVVELGDNINNLFDDSHKQTAQFTSLLRRAVKNQQESTKNSVPDIHAEMTDAHKINRAFKD